MRMINYDDDDDDDDDDDYCHHLELVFRISIWLWPACTTWGWQWPTWQTLLMQSRYWNRDLYPEFPYWPVTWSPFSSYKYCPCPLTIFKGSLLKKSLQDGPICFLRNAKVSLLGSWSVMIFCLCVLQYIYILSIQLNSTYSYSAAG